ncbi:MAG: ABC transporter ATP-binding protein [Candidatus Dormibacteria bacterium]
MSLEIVDLSVVFHRAGRQPVPAVVNVNLRVDPGRLMGLVGESGSGKSSLGRAAVGIYKPTAGSVMFNGEPVQVLGAWARPKSQIALQMVFQNPFESLNPRRRVGSQILDGIRASGMSRNDAARQRRVQELFEQLGLPERAAERYPHQFSGGQRQRIAIARALAVSPSIIVLDEPLASLDASAQAQLANTLRMLIDRLDVGLLLISHDLAIVRHVADDLSVMYLGQVLESGPTSEVWNAPLHPYTEALIAAIPKPDGKGVLPKAPVGEIGDPANPPSGCRFHPRCPYARQKCSMETPPLREVAPKRKVACWLHEPDRPMRSLGSGVPADLGPPLLQVSEVAM